MNTTTVARGTTSAQPTVMDQPTDQAALVRGEPTDYSALIRSPRELNARIEEWQKTYRVLSPMSQAMGQFLPGYALTWSIVQIETFIDPESKRGLDTYFNAAIMKAPAKEGSKNRDLNAGAAERALNLIGLRKISRAAGILWDPMHTRRLDDGRRRHYFEFRAYGRYRTPDGDFLNVDASAALDLRDGSAEIGYWSPRAWDAAVRTSGVDGAKEQFNGWSAARVLNARATGHRGAESRAKNAAIRDYGIPHILTVDVLDQPIVILRTVFIPDTSSPAIAEMVTAHALGATQLLYPHAASIHPLPRESRGDDEAEPADDVIDTELAHASEAGASASEAVRIVHVGEKSGETGGKKWTIWTVAFSDGRKAGTFNATLTARAQQLLADGAEVRPTIEPGSREGTYTLTHLVRATPTPAAESRPTAQALSAPLTIVDVPSLGPNPSTQKEVFEVRLSDGRAGRTDDAEIARYAEDLKEKKAPIAIDLEPSTRKPGVNIVIGLSLAEGDLL